MDYVYVYVYVYDYDCIGNILNAWNGIGLAKVHSKVFIGWFSSLYSVTLVK